MNEWAIIGHDLRNCLSIASMALERMQEKIKSGAISIDEIGAQNLRILKKLYLAQEICSAMMGEGPKKDEDTYEALDSILTMYRSPTFETELIMNHHSNFSLNRVDVIRIICNLVQNSIQSGATKFRLIVDKNQIVCQDNGGGMPAHKLTEWSQKGILRSQNADRDGCGLPSIKEICAKKNTRIEIKNNLMSPSNQKELGLEVKLVWD